MFIVTKLHMQDEYMSFFLCLESDKSLLNICL